MLQIISGRFFTGKEIEECESDSILYSNISFIAPIRTDVMEIRPADGFLSVAVSAYAIRYVNRMERGHGALVLADANEAVEQFRWLASFWFRAYFHPDYQQVQHACRQAPRTAADWTPPGRFVHRFFEPRLLATASDAEGFGIFIRKAISMPRKRYLGMIACVGTFFDALEVNGSNFDLAYSMLVYVLEALSKEIKDEYAPEWFDYDAAVKKRLGPVFERISEDDRSDIRRALLSERQFRLKQRFVKFVVEHTTNAFFITEAERVPHAIPRSKLETALKTLYDTRSGFVHQLTKVRNELRLPTQEAAASDYLECDQKCYLTLAGLVRLTHHVIGVFIDRQDSAESQVYPEWRNELPGTIRLKSAPQYWIWQAEGLAAEGARSRLSGLLEHLASQFPSKSWSCPDMTAVLSRVETLLVDCAREHRQPLKWLFFLCCWGHAELADRWATFQATHGMDNMTCDIEGLAISALFPDEPLTWEADLCEATFETYIQDRHKAGTTHLPLLFEVAVTARIASLHLANGDSRNYSAWLQRAIPEAAGHFNGT